MALDSGSHLSGLPLSVASILELGIRMPDALETAHQDGIIHRDIKPGDPIKVLDRSGEARG